MRIRLLKSEHERWSGLKQHRGLSTDNDVAQHLFDIADVASGCSEVGRVVYSRVVRRSRPHPLKSGKGGQVKLKYIRVENAP